MCLVNGVIVPLASVEQLGLHGPLGADFMVAQYVVPILAEGVGMLYTETVPFGDAMEMEDYPGTVSMPVDVLASFYYSLAYSYARAGAKRIVLFMTHSLNSRAADDAARRLCHEGYDVCLLDWWRAVRICAPGIIDDMEFGCGHGGEMITSVLMEIAPEYVHLERASNQNPKSGFSKLVKHIYGGGSACTAYGDFHDYSDTGTWGDVRFASADKGRALINKAIDLMVSELMETYS